MKSFLAAVVVAFFVLSCSHEDKIIVGGKIEGADGKLLQISKLDLNGLHLVDSARLKANGKYRFKIDAVKYPEFYYLQLDSANGLTLLLDTVQEITIHSMATRFLENAVIQGSPSTLELNVALDAVKKERKNYRNFVADYSVLPVGAEREDLMTQYSDHLKAFKDSLGREILKNPWSMTSYYILYQKLSDQFLLFDPGIKQDYKYFGAVATGLNMKYPEDPRVKAFYQMTLRAFKQQRVAEMQKLISEAEVGIPEIALPNLKGDTLSLNSLKGKVIVLNFWSVQSRESRMWNKTLAKYYKMYRGSGLEIYQVSVDKSKILWEKALQDDQVNWKSVGDFTGENSQAAMSYNVKKVPTTYIIDKNGDIAGRFDDETSLSNELKRLL